MAQDFLTLIRGRFGESNYAGDEFGGAGGTSGSGLPTGTPGNFMFATGIECSYPTIDQGRTRRDLLAECGHYGRYREDLGLVKELGLQFLRYGLHDSVGADPVNAHFVHGSAAHAGQRQVQAHHHAEVGCRHQRVRNRYLVQRFHPVPERGTCCLNGR